MRLVSLSVVLSALTAATAATAQDDRIVAFCDKMVECGREPDAATCVSNSEQSDENARGVGDAMCDEYADLELAWMGCVARLGCADLDDGCADEDEARNQLEWEGATACGNGDAPTPPPDGWMCDPGNFNAGDGCDCGCGGADWDCGDLGCAEGSCNAEGCGFCHDDDGDEFTCGGTPANDGPDDPGSGGVSGAGAAGPAGVTCAQAGAFWSPAAALLFVFAALRRRRQ